MTGLTTTRLTNHPPGAEPAPPVPLCAADAAELVFTSDVAETAASDASVHSNTDTNAQPIADATPDSWRVEVAARLERYRTRRKPRTPRYPSLLLPFDAPESWSRSLAPTGSLSVATTIAGDEQGFAVRTEQDPETGLEEPHVAAAAPEQSAKVLEFPRSAAIPIFHPSDLADPVFDRDRPRILEAPEILPPPPALGGMLIEPAQQAVPDRRPDLPSLSRPASIAQRALAFLVDSAILATSLAAFAAIFIRLNPNLNQLRWNNSRGLILVLAAALGVVAVLMWAAYEFLFVVYTGSTPGLRAARLRLAGFDGSPLNRRVRRWRVLASFLSAFSAGLGYFWCVLDQNGLCWHDRITRTHVQSAAPKE
jgi:uncharacterized RDD family membrane protein YckC